jgi:hypothetical protein
VHDRFHRRSERGAVQASAPDDAGERGVGVDTYEETVRPRRDRIGTRRDERAFEATQMGLGRDHDRHVSVADAVCEVRADGVEQPRVLAVELNGVA